MAAIYPSRLPSARLILPLLDPFTINEDELDRRYVVQGKKASLNEYNVAWALDQVGLSYYFRVEVGAVGNTRIAEIDFFVQTVPLDTPVFVHGDYFHRGDAREKDLRQIALVDDYYKGSINQAVEIWGHESETKEDALSVVNERIA